MIWSWLQDFVDESMKMDSSSVHCEELHSTGRFSRIVAVFPSWFSWPPLRVFFEVTTVTSPALRERDRSKRRPKRKEKLTESWRYSFVRQGVFLRVFFVQESLFRVFSFCFGNFTCSESELRLGMRTCHSPKFVLGASIAQSQYRP